MNETWPGDQRRRISTCLWALTHRVDLDRYSHLASLGLSFLICKVEATIESTSLDRRQDHRPGEWESRFVTCKAWDEALSRLRS